VSKRGQPDLVEPVEYQAPPAVAEQPVVAEQGFEVVEPSPFVAEPGAREEEPVVAEEEPWFVADVQEPAPAKDKQSDTWSGRPIGS
jgi:hypothetical protein